MLTSRISLKVNQFIIENQTSNFVLQKCYQTLTLSHHEVVAQLWFYDLAIRREALYEDQSRWRIERLFLTKNNRKQAMIVRWVTICWRAYYDEVNLKKLLVIKNSWQFEKRFREEKLIKEVMNKDIRNIAQYYYHKTI